MRRRRPLPLPWLWLLASAALGADPLYETVAFEVTRQREVMNDRVYVILAAQADGRDPAKVADEVNRAMRWALERIPEGIRAQSGDYVTLPLEGRDGIERWRAVQELRLEAGESLALVGLLGQLQERLQVRSMAFFVSDARREAAEQALIAEVVHAFLDRAEALRREFGAGAFRLVAADIRLPPPLGAVALERGVPAPPVLRPGVTAIAVTVSGAVQLLSR